MDLLFPTIVLASVEGMLLLLTAPPTFRWLQRTLANLEGVSPTQYEQQESLLHGILQGLVGLILVAFCALIAVAAAALCYAMLAP